LEPETSRTLTRYKKKQKRWEKEYLNDTAGSATTLSFYRT